MVLASCSNCAKNLAELTSKRGMVSSMNTWQKLTGYFLVGIGFSTIGLPLEPAYGQTYPECPGPSAGEYLLLVRGQTEAERNRIVSVLPADNPVLVCNYLGEVVVRSSGFTDLESANAWALYLNDIEQFDAFVAQAPAAVEPAAGASPPAMTATPATPVTTATNATAATSYQPQTLGQGYAVLVDYSNRPELATEIGQQLSTPIGLAVYRQQPYLLIVHTAAADTAAQRLQQLSNAGFTAILVDGQQVVRLLSQVNP
jgi:hypothetical protein